MTVHGFYQSASAEQVAAVYSQPDMTPPPEPADAPTEPAPVETESAPPPSEGRFVDEVV